MSASVSNEPDPTPTPIEVPAAYQMSSQPYERGHTVQPEPPAPVGEASDKHPHDYPPVFDSEGRCLPCGINWRVEELAYAIDAKARETDATIQRLTMKRDSLDRYARRLEDALSGVLRGLEGDCDTPGTSQLCQTHFLEPPPCSVAVARAALKPEAHEGAQG